MVGIVDPHSMAGADHQLKLGVGQLPNEPLGEVRAAEGIVLAP
jgi:hypothetical protein